MAKNRHRLGFATDVKQGEASRFVVGPHKIAVVRVGDDFYAIGDTCSHADYSLSEGEVDVGALQIECWKHGSCFSLETGEPDTMPATQPVPTYDIDVADDEIWVTIHG